MLKRPRDAFDTPDSSSPPLPASKRRYLSSSATGSSPSTSRSVSCLSTPYTLPYFRSPYSESIPHDSPSNPFGLNRALRALTIPRPTGFSKHIVLRMQLVSTADPVARPRNTALSDAPYRIVQVPLNYSFRILHMLVLFLLASDARLRVRRRKRAANHDLRSRAPPASRKPKHSVDLPEDPPEVQNGHLFEVYDGMRLYTNTYRPGVIKVGTGKLYAKLSSTRERKLFPDGPAGGVDNDVFGGPSHNQSNVETTGETADTDDGEDGWDWEPEDDFLLSGVWTDGPSLKKGIIYHHTPSTSVHITVNTARVPPRKGIGNEPYVFAAHGGTAGAVRIANITPAPSSAPPSVSTSTTSQHLRVRKGKQHTPDNGSDSERDWDSSSGSDTPAPERPYADTGDEVPELGAHEDADEDALERWNAHNAFERFLKREAARERAVRRPKPVSGAVAGPSRVTVTHARMAEGDFPSSPIGARGGAHRYGHRRYVTGERDPDVDPDGDAQDEGAYLPPSSPSTLPIDIPSDCDALWTDTDGELPDEDARENMRYMIELSLQTPFPAHPALRRRVRRASERMERQVSKGLSEFDEDEPDGQEDGQKAGETGAKGKENVVAKAHHKTGVRGREPDPEESPVKERVAARNAHPPLPPPTTQPDSPSEENETEAESGEGSIESVEVDGYTMGAPWLYMRGPKDGSSSGRGSLQWDSDEEV
ncbi:hypothetical protein TRAPUB_2948 [Trametes pubescens]|uniref:Uncharacterized protein n=1 Tax=Trametes pubescens TaxID=154538 RepID=A0A1M2VF14_TRAPU|nr:hypothetical protein TRAPUB_2948 [Trametes pubescens]